MDVEESEPGLPARRASGPETRLKIFAGDRPLWLCFEPWATQYTVAAGTSVVIDFDSDQTPVEVVHQADGIVFFSFGRHPDVWSPAGEPLLIWSTDAPRTPDVAHEAIRHVIAAIPPIRTGEE